MEDARPPAGSIAKFREEKREVRVAPTERLPDLSLKSVVSREGHTLKTLQFQGTVVNGMETLVPEA